MIGPRVFRDVEETRAAWIAAWPTALSTWSKFTRLRPPVLCLTTSEAKHEGLAGSFAMIRLNDQSVVVSLPEVLETGVENYAVEVLAHEIGHHVLAPATLTDHARTIARMRWSLPTVEAHAPMVANLYTDLLINDRLQRGSGLRIADIYQIIGGKGGGGAVWALYTRMYEILWSLPRGTLKGGETTDAIEGDAVLGARVVRSFARDWIEGAGRFAALLLPHLLKDEASQTLINKLLDTRHAASGGEPAGLAAEEEGERSGAIHPADDPALSGEDDSLAADQPGSAPSDPGNAAQKSPGGGQAREPYQYGELLRAAGIILSDHEAAVRYYRERARPHLITFPSRILPESSDPLPEGLAPWEIGDSFDDADWIQTVLQSPQIIPGLTTVQRVWGTSEGREPERQPLDLDLYVDCSGSMPNPQRNVSYLTLAGAILCLSALRAGSRVQVTLWSGKNQVTTTPGFVRHEIQILEVLSGFFGGGTAFPIHILRETYANRPRDARPVHILVISDDGVTTMFDQDEKGNSGWDIAQMALDRARGGGTFVLNLMADWDKITTSTEFPRIKRARLEQGWNVHRVAAWDDLVKFAREFSRLRFGPAPIPKSTVEISS